MAVTSGTIKNINTVKADAVTPLQCAEVLFTMTGTYNQSDDSILSDVSGAIESARRNGKTVTLVDACLSQPANEAASLSDILAAKTVAISTDDITFELTEGDYTTELTAAAIPAQNRPFGLLVSFTEA